MIRRAELMAQSIAERKKSGGPAVDAEEEKRLWKIWLDASKDKGLDMKLVRRLFVVLNGLTYEHAEDLRRGAYTLTLAPELKPFDSILMEGPTSHLAAMAHTAAAARSKKVLSLSPVILNDPLLDLVKALNQIGAKLDWKDNAVTAELGGGVRFSERRIYVGNEIFTFFHTAALAVSIPGRSTFVGGPYLKSADLKSCAAFLLELGVRMTSIEPYSTGLPVRVESAGTFPSRVTVPEELPAEALAAFVLAAPIFPEGMRFSCASEQMQKFIADPWLACVLDVLQQWGITIEEGEGELVVPHGELTPPSAFLLPLDGALTALVASFVRVCGGSLRLKGPKPKAFEEKAEMFRFLEMSGLILKIEDEGISVEAGEAPAEIVYDCGKDESLLALAVALVAGCPGRAELIFDVGSEHGEAAGRILRLTGRTIFEKPGGITMEAGRPEIRRVPQSPFPVPSPIWNFTLCAVSYLAQGVSPSEPGALATVWPGFWHLFRTVLSGKSFDPQEAEGEADSADNNEDTKHDGPKKRRIVLK
jgi:5-enolpyruvylshikimate-3-phosphate synthase/chorismate mutase